MRLHKNQVAVIMAVVLVVVLVLNFKQAEEAARWLHPGLLAVLQTVAFILMYVGAAFGELARLPERHVAVWFVRIVLGVMAVCVFGWLAVQNVLVTYTHVSMPAEVEAILQLWTGWDLRSVRLAWAMMDAGVRVGLEALASVVIAVLLWMPDEEVQPAPAVAVVGWRPKEAARTAVQSLRGVLGGDGRESIAAGHTNRPPTDDEIGIS